MVVDIADGGAAGMTPEERIAARLEDVLDPCSCFTEEPVNIVELGLVDDVRVEDGVARIDLLLTSPGCSYYPYIERDVEERVGGIEGIDGVEVEQITDEVWTRDRMAPGVREARRERMRERLDDAGVTPYAGRTE